MGSFNEDVNFNSDKPQLKVIIDSKHSKEVRIVMSKGSELKEHQTPFQILVHVLVGNIDFTHGGVTQSLEEGRIISLEPDIPHSLIANDNSIIRLSLIKIKE